MSWLRIRNWNKWQSYRTDRGQPPWIKVHRTLMRDANWVSLTDAERGQLVAIWMLAADRDGVIPASKQMVRKLCFMDTEPDIENFVAKGFIEPDILDAMPTPERRQPDANVTHQSRVEERRVEERAADAATTPAGKDFAFKGRFVKGLNQEDFSEWLKAYPTFTRTSLLAELKRCDEYYGGRGFSGKVPKNWFVTTSSWLGRTHERAMEAKKTGTTRRHSPEIELAIRGAR
jgi:hypothetical protein